MIKNNTRIILASASPRRRALLESIGFKCTAASASVVEDGMSPLSMLGHQKPAGIAVAIACRKADAVSRRIKGHAVLIAADTIVVMDKRIIGKPSGKKHAEEILRLLSGKTHKVITGVCLLKVPERISRRFSVATDVTMLKMTGRDIQWYISTGEPMDKAGAYGIQGLGGLFVKKINGSYTNVVGLPLTELFDGLRRLGAITL